MLFDPTDRREAQMQRVMGLQIANLPSFPATSYAALNLR